MLLNQKGGIKMKKSLLILGIIFFSRDVSAYINPGMGITIISSLWALILIFLATVGAYLIRHFWSPIKRKLFGVKKKNGN